MDNESEEVLYEKFKKLVVILRQKELEGPSLSNEEKLFFYGHYKVIEEGKAKGKTLT
jgi:hypothetical protein